MDKENPMANAICKPPPTCSQRVAREINSNDSLNSSGVLSQDPSSSTPKFNEDVLLGRSNRLKTSGTLNQIARRHLRSLVRIGSDVARLHLLLLQWIIESRRASVFNETHDSLTDWIFVLAYAAYQVRDVNSIA
jgi:hypothetical protein